jgi:ParB/RepB/Spo0J family partition protein
MAIATTDQTHYSARNIVEIPINLIQRSDLNPRKHFDEAGLEELAQSIRQHGLIEPIVVRQDPRNRERFLVVVGERRWQASLRAGSAFITARNLGEIDDQTHLELALVENLQRRDLDPIDEAEGYRQLNQVCGMTQAQIAEAVNRSQPAVANAMRLLELPDDVRAKIQHGQLTPAHGRALVKYAKWPKLCSAITELAIKEGYTSKRLENGFDSYEGVRAYSLPDDVLVAMGYDMRKAAEEAGLTILEDRFTPDVEAYNRLVADREAAEKKLREERLAAARAAAHVAEPEEIETDDDSGPLPGRDPNTKNGRRRLRKDAEKAEAASVAHIPKLADLPYDSYEVVGDSYGRPWPKACGPDCECRAKAVDRNGKIVDISTRPRHISSLRAAELRKQKEAEKKAALSLEQEVHTEVAAAPAFDSRGLAVVAAALLTSTEGYKPTCDSDVRSTLLKQHVPDPPRHLFAGGVDREALDALAAVPAQTLMRLMLEALLQTDLERIKKDAGQPPLRLTWYLTYVDPSSPAEPLPPAESVIEAEPISSLEEARQILLDFLHDCEEIEDGISASDLMLVALTEDVLLVLERESGDPTVHPDVANALAIMQASIKKAEVA